MIRSILLVAGVWCASLAMAQSVPFSVVTETTDVAGALVKVDVYRPYETANDGVAVLAHGFSRDRSRDRDLGRDLAHAGITAIAPDLPNVVDYWGSGDAVLDIVRQLESGAFGLPPTPRTRIVLIGTSAGAVGTVIAASKLPGLGGWIGLDPVDRWGIAARAAAKLTTPAVVLLGDSSVCNLFGSGRSIAQAVPTLLRSERIRGASHCDFEGPTDNFCRTVCGKGARGMDETVRQRTVNAAFDVLGGAPSESSMPDGPDDEQPAR